ncbi:MAG: thioredoxin fold domain-containing protein [Gammaproteobacteria bacterium]|nr:thioredoxin fold domain-containing protein [Gammaproteobacteria bacterium]
MWRISGTLLLFWAGSFSPGFALPAPAPTSAGLTQTLSFDAKRPVPGPLSGAFDAVNPCGRSNELSWVPAPAWDQEVVLDFDEVFLKATAERRRTMLVVYEEDCSGWTRMVAPLLEDNEILGITREEFHVYHVNTDDEEQMFRIDGRAFSAPQLADILGVEKYPAFIFFEGDGKLALSIEHPESQLELKSALEYAVVSNDGVVGREQYGTYETSEGNIHTLLEEGVQPPSQFVLQLEDKADDRPLAVFFEKPDCHHCDHFRQLVLSDSRTQLLLERFRVARFELPSTSVLITLPDRQLTVAQWSRELGVTGTPTVVFFDKSGKPIGQTSDHTDLSRFQSQLDYVISGAY